MLEVLNLCARRGEKTLFDTLSFCLERGEALHVHGPNGSGKTTLLRLICALFPPLSGEIRWQSVSVPALDRTYASRTLYLGHRNALKEELTPLENLECAFRFAAPADGPPFDRNNALDALKRLGVPDEDFLLCRHLSEGQKRRVALSRLVLFGHRPLWILDEPCAALDARAVREVASLTRAHLQRGGIVVTASPHAEASGLPAGRKLRVGDVC